MLDTKTKYELAARLNKLAVSCDRWSGDDVILNDPELPVLHRSYWLLLSVNHRRLAATEIGSHGLCVW